MTFAQAAENVGDGDSGRSRKPSDARDSYGAERLHLMVTNWHRRTHTGLLAMSEAVAQPHCSNFVLSCQIHSHVVVQAHFPIIDSTALNSVDWASANEKTVSMCVWPFR